MKSFNLQIITGLPPLKILSHVVVVVPREKKWQGVDATPYCSSAGFNSASPILSEITSTLSALDIHIEQMHCESGGGQFELAVGHFPCIVAADNLLLLREAVTAIADKHDLRATFLPK